MNWKMKVRVQRAIALLPEEISDKIYYRVQRRFGRIPRPYDPINAVSGGIPEGVFLLQKLQAAGFTPIDKVFFEVGTGWTALVPLSFWLAGAKKTITVDLNPLLRGELISESLCYIREHEQQVADLFGALLQKERFAALLEFSKRQTFDLSEYLALCGIEYAAPCDAAKTKLADASVDYHISNAVLEHIPWNILKDIFVEGNRIVKRDGIFIHRIDYSDHYATDKSISGINFLQYSDSEWRKYTNRYAYVNRLRHDDFISLFAELGHEILVAEVYKDEYAQQILDDGTFRVAEKFLSKSKDVLAIIGACFVTKKK